MNRVVIGLVAVFASFALLHGGKTDSNGGHYDRSAGEYHYHHGYSGHDHYDMDGDGDIDCPYTFKDNTKRSSSTIETELDDFSSNFYSALGDDISLINNKSWLVSFFDNDDTTHANNTSKDVGAITITACILVVIVLEVIYLVIDKFNRRK